MNKVRACWKNFSIGERIESINALLMLLASILSIALDGGKMKINDNSRLFLYLFGLIGVAFDVLSLLLRKKKASFFLPVLSSVCYAIACGRALELFGYPIADKATGVNWFGGNFVIYLLYFLLFFIGMILSIVVCFLSEKTKTE